MESVNKLIVIWGAAILLYLLVANSTGTSSMFSGIKGLVVGSTKALQGR
jgi:hypothetical protein